MTRFKRRFFLLSFVFLFMLTVPVVVLTTQGYRFNWKKGIFIYSGSVTVKSWPQDIDVFLDGKKKGKKKLNPINGSITINGLRPGKHSIHCKKEGYTSWGKTFTVHSGVSTEFKNVLLFPLKQNSLTSFKDKNIKQFFISPRDKNELVYFQHRGDERIVSLLDIKKNKSQEIFTTNEFDYLSPQQRENVEWNNNHKKILIPFQKNNQRNYLVANIKDSGLNTPLNIQTILDDYSSEKTFPKKARWAFNKNNVLIVLTTNNDLFYVDINDPSKTILLEKKVSGFDLANSQLYYTQLPGNIIWEISNYDPLTKKQITHLGLPNDDKSFLEITAFDQNHIALITHQKELYVYNVEKEKNEKSFEKVFSSIEGIQFSNDAKKLLFWTNNEIWVLMLRDWEVQPIRHKNEKIFITRFSSPVTNVQWMENYENIIFSTEKIVKVAELDNRDHVNIVDVAKFKDNLDDRKVLYNKSDQILYVLTNENKETLLQSTLLLNKTNFLGL